jgi:hypothetical protein
VARNRNSRIFKLYALANTRIDADENIICKLCSSTIGHGANVMDLFDAAFIHRILHAVELDAFVEPPKQPSKACVFDHAEIVARHKGARAIECARCHQLLWKPEGCIDTEALAAGKKLEAQSCVDQHASIIAIGRSRNRSVICGSCNRIWKMEAA